MDERAVSPVIGTLMVLTILTVVTATMLTVVWPEIQDNRARGEFGIVVTQMGALTADARQMASLGNVGELRQASVAIGGGSFYVAHGHLYAVSTSVLDPDYLSVNGESREPGKYARFHVVNDPAAPVQATDTAFTLRYLNDDTAPTAVTLEVDRFDGRRWVEAPAAGCTIGSIGGSCVIELPLPLRDGPWRVQALDGSTLHGEIYLYEQNQIAYEQHARRERAAVLENGALFTREDTAILQAVPSLWQGLASDYMGASLQGRSTTFKASEFPIATGRSTSSLALTTLTHAHLAHQHGVLETRVQVLSGPLVDAWHRHFVHVGFAADADPALGVTQHAESEDDLGAIVHDVYPFSMVHVDLGLRMEVR